MQLARRARAPRSASPRLPFRPAQILTRSLNCVPAVTKESDISGPSLESVHAAARCFSLAPGHTARRLTSIAGSASSGTQAAPDRPSVSYGGADAYAEMPAAHVWQEGSSLQEQSRSCPLRVRVGHRTEVPPILLTLLRPDFRSKLCLPLPRIQGVSTSSGQKIVGRRARMRAVHGLLPCCCGRWRKSECSRKGADLRGLRTADTCELVA